MRSRTGLGNIPPVRRWETARLVIGSSGVPALRAVVDTAEKKAARRFFTPTFQVEARDFGIAPRSTASPVAAMQGGSLNGVMDRFFDRLLAPAEACDELKGHRAQITKHLETQPNSEGLRTTAFVLLSTTVTDCRQSLPTYVQLHDALIADSRALRGQTPMPSNLVAAQAGEPPPAPPASPSFWDNFYKDGKLTPVGIGSIVAGGLLIAAIGTGTAGALLGRRR